MAFTTQHLYAFVKAVVPVFEVMYIFVIVAWVAVSGNPPPIIATDKPAGLHTVDETVNGLKPMLVVVMLDDGLKIPMLYNITATMTMIRIAQP